MLINTNHRASDQRPTDSSDTTQDPTPLHRRPYWNQTSAAFSVALWLPAGTTDRGSLINTAHGLDQQHRGPFMVLYEPHRGPKPRPAQALLANRSPSHHCSHHRWRHQATGSPDTGLSRPHPEARYRHLADRQPLDLQPHRRDPAVRHSGRLETHRQHGNAGSQSATSRMGFGSLPGETHGSQGRLPRPRPTSRPSTWNSSPSQAHGQQNRRSSSPNSATAAGEEPQAVLLHSRRRRDGARRLSHYSGTTPHGRGHVPAEHKECRLVQERGLYWLIVPYAAQCDIETPSGDGVVALDPGVRTFLTYFSETDCGKLGHHAFGRIQRRCHWLDDLISRTTKEPNRRKRRQMRAAQARIRQRITNLVDELHWQLARWLTSNYRIILLPTFETHDLTQRAGRKIRSKTARMMLTFRHLRVQAASCGGKPGSAARWCSTSTRRTPASPAAGTAP